MSSAVSSKSALKLAQSACDYFTKATDPFHAVYHAIQTLETAGFTKYVEQSTLQKGGKYYYVVENSTLVSFVVGQQFDPSGGGILIVGGHTDSPNFRVKPHSKKPNKHHTVQLGVQAYGGGLWHTWFDRDLSLSGKVLVRENQKIVPKLVQFHDPVARISNLCIHLQSADERRAFTVNKEDHTSPILAMSDSATTKQVQDALQEQLNHSSFLQGQEPRLLQRIAAELNLDSVTDICDFDLSLYDTQPATIGGMDQDFLYSGRLDNLATVFCAVHSLSQFDPATSADICMVVAFDHEEIGSTSVNGAGSPVINHAIQKLTKALDIQDNHSLLTKSFCLSIDQAHAIHPNYASKHEPQHAPYMNGGIVIKTNANQRYATSSLTGFVVRELCRQLNIPVQEFCVRNDCPCGSTIGPTISALTGVRVVDAGMPQLSMHSCREVMGVKDLVHGVDLFNGFFGQFRELDDSIQRDI